MSGLVELGLKFPVRSLEGQDGGDTGQIEAAIEEPADLPEADEIVVAVATRTALAAAGLIRPRVS